MAKYADITALKTEWKTLFTQWHLGGCREGTWYCTKSQYNTNSYDLHLSNESLDEYLKTGHGYHSSNCDFAGTQLFYSNGIIILAAECKNERKIGWLIDTYKRQYPTREFMSAFNIIGITPTIEKTKSSDYLLIKGTLDSFEKSEFYVECKKIYDERLNIKQEWETFQKATITNVLNNKERLIAIYNSPLLERVRNFDKTNHLSFMCCNKYSVHKHNIFATEVYHPIWEEDYYRFELKENGYQNLSDSDFPLFAVALMLTRYKCNPTEIENFEMEKLLMKYCSFGKEEIGFEYHAGKEEITPELKGVLE